jgi:hypothetical protein
MWKAPKLCGRKNIYRFFSLTFLSDANIACGHQMLTVVATCALRTTFSNAINITFGLLMLAIIVL